MKSNRLRQRFGFDGDGITVVVLDSGIADHAELGSQVEEHRTFNGPPGDGFNHGTKVAGIIAGDDGAAPAAILWDIKVVDNGGGTTIAILLQALDDLADEMDSFQILVGAFSDPTLRFATACDPLNPAAAQVVNAFRDAGKLLIGSSGNEADGTGVGIPACLDAILATGAVYDANVGSVSFGGCTDATTAADKIACYSNGGPLVDFYAPGHCTRAPSATGGFDNCFGGTSASAAYVAGVAAQIMGGKSDLTAASLTNAFKSTGPNLTDSRSGISRRRIDGEAAYESVRGEEEPTPTPTPDQDGDRPGAGAVPHAYQDGDRGARRRTRRAVGSDRPGRLAHRCRFVLLERQLEQRGGLPDRGADRVQARSRRSTPSRADDAELHPRSKAPRGGTVTTFRVSARDASQQRQRTPIKRRRRRTPVPPRACATPTPRVSWQASTASRAR